MEYSPKKNKEKQNDKNDKEEVDEESSINLKKYQNCEIIKGEIFNGDGDLEIYKFYKGCFLGKGAFAQCYEFISQDNEKLYAGKIIPKSSLETSRSIKKLIDEIKIHKSLDHPNIVKLEHYFENKENVYILLELCANKTMHDLLKRRKHLTELEVQCYMIQLINALKYLRSEGIIHRDLKIRNIFLSEKMELKVGDFGFAAKLDFDFEKRRTICGTPNYIAPEILEEEPYSYKVDIWSLGIIMYTLIIGRPPFDSSEEKKIYKKIKKLDYSFPENVIISEAAKDLIKQILVLDPLIRPNLDQILSHDFFNLGTGIPKLLLTSTLKKEPDIDYIRQFMPEADENGIVNIKVKTTDLLEEKLDGELNYEKKEKFNNNQKIKEPNIWVKKWIDYSNKYGLGYALNNGNFGAYFNDSTKMILNPETKIFFYIKRKEPEKQLEYYKYDLDNYPEEIKKKVTLLNHFKIFLEDEMNESKLKNKIEYENDIKYEEKIKKENEEDDKNEIKNKEEDNNKPFIYIKRWIRTSQAIIFKTSTNSIYQLIFNDHTEILLSVHCRMVTYVNKKRERITYPLFTALDCDNYEIILRLKYTKDIFVYMLTKASNIKEQNANLDSKLKQNDFNNQEKEEEDTESNLEKNKEKEEKEEK